MVLVGIAIIVGLTRTKAGRDAIRQQVETAFNQRYEGQLSIGTLRGTLIDDVVATNVELRTPSGERVAVVDSIRAVPRWANLLTAELSMRTLMVYRPQVFLRRDSSGTWNARRALDRTAPSSTTAQPFDLTFTRLEVREGTLSTEREGTPPDIVEEGWLFDYTRTQIQDFSLQASARRNGPNSVLDISAASFNLPGALLQPSLSQGLLRRTATGWSLDDLDLTLGTTRLRGRASLQTTSSDPNDNSFSLILDRSRIDHGELKHLIPRLPFADVVTLEGELGGTLARLQADDVTVTHNASFATLDGTIARQPETFALDLQLRESEISLGDVEDVWPGLSTVRPATEVGPLNVEGTLQGTAARPRPSRRGLDFRTTLTVQSQHGAIQGSLNVARTGAAPLQYDASIRTDSLNLAPFTGRPELTSRLSGQLDARGKGLQGDTLSGSLDLSLSPSILAGRPLGSADGQATFTHRSAEGQLFVRQENGGSVRAEGSVDRMRNRPIYTAVVSSSDLNLSSLTDGLPRTELNGRLTLRAAGTDWQSLTGTLVADVDTSNIYRSDSTVGLPSHSATVRLSGRRSDRPRFTLSGTVGTLTVDGNALGPPLWNAVRTWTGAFRDAYREERNKPAPSSPIPPPRTPSTSEAASALSLTSRDRPADELMRAQATLRVRQPRILHAWWAAFPKRTEDLTAEARLSLSTDSLRATGQFSATRLSGSTYETRQLDAHYTLASQRGAPLAQSTQATATVSARRVVSGSLPIQQLTGSLEYGGRRGTLRLTADSLGIADSVRLASELRITPRTNEMRVHDLSINVNGATWSNPSSGAIRTYAGQVVVTPFRLERPHPQTPSLQKLEIGGTLSSAPTDTLTVEATNVYLPPFSQALGKTLLIGGNLGGRLDLQGGLGRPTLTTDLSVRRLSYDRRILGDAHLRTTYSAGSPTLSLDGSLRAEDISVDSLAGPSLVPGTPQSVDPNRLSLSGKIRLPSWARSSAPPPSTSDALDLSVDIERADLFFFRYIFEERVSRVQGYTTGDLHIGGHVRDPVFDANLRIVNGGVTLPLFGLQYEVEGPVMVDKQGIHPRGLAVRDEEGTGTIEGSVLFNDYQYFSFDLSADLDGITVINVSQAKDLPFYGYIRATGPLHLTGPLSDATLRSNAARTTPDSELFIPVTGETVQEDTGFIVFADSTGRAPDIPTFTRRQNILGDRPEGVPTFVEGLNLDFNVTAPEESTVNLVFDPIVGDVVTVVGSGRVQLQRKEGDFSVYGNFRATSGTYLFTAGEVFVRRFSIAEGTITWDGDPTNAQLDLDAEYRTRASPTGLPGFQNARGRIPVTVLLDITGRVTTPRVDLGLSLTRSEERNLVGSESLDAILNQPARTTEYATSVLLTNTFLLTTESITQRGRGGETDNSLTTAGNQLAFNSVSQLVSSQLNRYLGQALPNVDLNFGVQGEDPDDLDLIYGVALRLLNERLVIRGEGVYTSDTEERQVEGPQGEFVLEVRLSSRVSAKVFYRRDGDELTRNQSLMSSRGAGVSYQTQFSTWRSLFQRLFGWLLPSNDPPTEEDAPPPQPVAEESPAPTDSTAARTNPQ